MDRNTMIYVLGALIVVLVIAFFVIRRRGA